MRPAAALVSCRAARGLDEDMPPLLAAFAAVGVHAEIADWDDPLVEWGRFDVALLRSAWDYTDRLGEFLAWVERTATLTQLLHPPEIVRWNADKHYLQTLAGAGVAVVPSTFAEPGADGAAAVDEFLAREGCAELVVKPAVGAGARDTRRYAREAAAAARAHVQRLLGARRSVLLQPYLPSVERDGESALIYLDGHFSHAIRKGPLLPAGGAATAALFAAEEITPRRPAAAELAAATGILRALPFSSLLYGRIDLIRGADGAPLLLELEITEPSLYFRHGAGAAARFVAGVGRRLGWPATSENVRPRTQNVS
ncbi:MAG: hypothetical protein JO341_02670 [Gammaproteobacteria bacterium]|nr:hypothetical protein [Gammaproteobacteria bacterium]